jgi:HSP20 family molecular chaperone IbpA
MRSLFSPNRTFLDATDSLLNGKLYNDVFSAGTLGIPPRIVDDGAARHYEFAVPGATKDALTVELDKNVLTVTYMNGSGYSMQNEQYVHYLPADVDLDDDFVLTFEPCTLIVTVRLSRSTTPTLHEKRTLTIN